MNHKTTVTTKFNMFPITTLSCFEMEIHSSLAKLMVQINSWGTVYGSNWIFSLYVFLLSLLFGQYAISSTDARRDPGNYWRAVLKDEPIPEAIQRLMPHDQYSVPLSKVFEPRPTVTAYYDDTGLKQKRSFVKDFEPRPTVTAYNDDTGLKQETSFTKQFEPRPTVTAYNDDTGLKQESSFTKQFEPRPTVTAYYDDTGLKHERSIAKNFEPRPTVTAYLDDDKSADEDFEPKPNVI